MLRGSGSDPASLPQPVVLAVVVMDPTPQRDAESAL